MKMIPKPQPNEYAPYAAQYVSLLPDDGRVLEHLESSLQEVSAMLRPLSDAQLSTPCKPGEWTIKEILGHVMDSERVFAYRALRFARQDTTDLPGFDQDSFVACAGSNARTLDDLIDEYVAIRKATLMLFQSFDDAALMRAGTANKYTMSVRAAAYIIAGHERHHINSIQENYLSS